MRIFFLALTVQVAFVTRCVAQLNERLEKLDRGDRGIAEKLIITRGGSVVYERLQLDKNRDGKFESAIEKLSVSGQAVVHITLVEGKRGTVVQNTEDTQVIFSSESDSWRPDSVYIEVKTKGFEFFKRGTDGFYRPVGDEDKKRIGTIAKATDELAESVTKGDAGEIKKAVINLQKSGEKEPNQQPPEPTPTTVTPPAGRLRTASPGGTQEARQP